MARYWAWGHFRSPEEMFFKSKFPAPVIVSANGRTALRLAKSKWIIWFCIISPEQLPANCFDWRTVARSFYPCTFSVQQVFTGRAVCVKQIIAMWLIQYRSNDGNKRCRYVGSSWIARGDYKVLTAQRHPQNLSWMGGGVRWGHWGLENMYTLTGL